MSNKKTPRIFTFDLLRGYFLIAIILNHLYYFPNGLDWVTMRGELFVSSAEGFFFISGIVLGIVRGAKLINLPFRAVARLLLKRSLQLYLTYIATTLIFIFAGWFFIDNPGLKAFIPAIDTPILTLLWNVLSFDTIYGWTDYLRLYCFFLLASPIAMWLLRRGWWWIVLTASTLIWLISPVISWPENIYIQPYNWQLVFFGGLIVGYHWEQISEWWKQRSESVRRLTVTGTLLGAALTLGFSIVLAFGGYLSQETFAVVSPLRDTLSPYFDKENLPVARLLLFLLWFWASFWIVRRFEAKITRALGWLLLPFGTNSLYVYIVSGVIIFFTHLLLPEGNILVNFFITVGIISVIWLMTRYNVLMKIIPR